MFIFLIILLCIVSIALVAVVLIQSGKGSGLTSAFGAGDSQAVFGSRAGDFLTKATTIFAVAFMVICVLLTIYTNKNNSSVGLSSRTDAPVSSDSGPRMTLAEIAEREQLVAAEQASNELAIANSEALIEDLDSITDTAIDTINTDTNQVETYLMQ